MKKIEKIRALRARLASGGKSIGSWMQIPHAAVAEIMGHAGYDWIAVDLEHGAIAINELPDLFRALELGGTLPLARIAEGSSKDCKQALDAGAAGVIVPMVESEEQLEAIRNACCWPPAGKRGVGFSRANLFGKYFDEYHQEAQAPILVAMIENVCATDRLEKILQVKGLDAILIGPYDLSASMGITAQFEHALFREVMGRIKKISDTHHVPCGVHVVAPSREQLKQKIGEGYRFLAYSMDAVMLNHAVSIEDL